MAGKVDAPERNQAYPGSAWSAMKAGPAKEPPRERTVFRDVPHDDERVPGAARNWVLLLRRHGWQADVEMLTSKIDESITTIVGVLGRREQDVTEWLVAYWTNGKFSGARGGHGQLRSGLSQTANATARQWIKNGVPADVEAQMWSAWQDKYSARVAKNLRDAAVALAAVLGGVLMDVRKGVVDGAYDEASDVVCPAVMRTPQELVGHANHYHGVSLDPPKTLPDLEHAVSLHDEAHAASGLRLMGKIGHRHERWPLGLPPKPRNRKEASDGEES